MIIAVPKESLEGESRVALDPNTVSRLTQQGLKIHMESGAGEKSFFPDSAYTAAGATVISDGRALWSSADILLKINPPTEAEANLLKRNAILIGLLNPFVNQDIIGKLSEKGVTAFALELIPRISRAQSMDVLSSQASIAGYKAVLIAAMASGKYFPMLTTAAGTIPPAKVLIIGAGVAGLQAIATARRLGAVVEAYDVRAEVREQVQSLGAKYVSVDIQEETATQEGYAKEVSKAAQEKIQQTLTEHVKKSDIVITTAQVPGKKAPRIITENMIAQMSAGSVIVDLAAEQGGNCAYSQPAKTVIQHGVTILGPVNVPASMPIHASQMYAKNISTFLKALLENGKDEIIQQSCVTRKKGEVNP